MKPIVQAFATGVLVSSLIILAVYMLSNPSQNVQDVAQEEETLIVEDAKKFLVDEGFSVIEDSEYDDLIREKQQLEKEVSDFKEEQSKLKEELNEIEEESSSNEAEESESNNQPSSESEYLLSIESGMTSIDIAQNLETANIVDDADQFNNFLEDNGYSRLIQLGEYRISNDATYEEIAQIITN
ncbi:hypothetical protein [Aquisalibacillus elongatus]|nr:hypothetical protein [Aquisalibacillus elongatus]